MNFASRSVYEPREWVLAHNRSIVLGPNAVVMGILNATPDSFSDGGQFQGVDAAIKHGLYMASKGAAILDIGGESTRPNAEPVSPEIEQSRVLPIIEALASHDGIILSIDTHHSATAQKAVQAGAHIINDVWGLQKDHDMVEVAAKTGAGCLLMHTGRERERNRDVIADQLAFLSKTIEIAKLGNINPSAIVLDPGFGFAKDADEDLELLANFEKLHQFGFPLLTGASRKRFIGAASGRDVGDRDVATAASSVVARLKGSAVFRVHDIEKNRNALAIADAVLAAKQYESEP